ncbi:KPN_02809 family neutral zinc metallopeptidase [Rhodococcus artemisiae]|uniref:Neutral zinc metallopeptidase n=1 Tax=Rhodococcus artemisiae TaxID=714159 RepID=A0ABU7L3W1_9NOCA|nr:neutral zinc metallopeptidase [Rhodococcus artemisiae]MEE2056222.1 neutral zinc metallopeptidase [Rhodococcus artemisiae]
MTFNQGARMDPNRVRTGGGGRGGKIALGGGAGGLIVLILALLLGGDPSSLLGSGVPDASEQAGTGALDHCATGTDANADVDCRVLYTVGSLDTVWEQQLAAQTGVAYVQPEVALFTSATSTGCGNATSDIGPFYCPADETAYFDTSFFQQLVTQFGSSGGPLAQEYVVAHEVGHHLQNQLGDLGRAQSDPRGPESGAVRTELQADCYAGVWAHYADTLPDPDTGVPFLAPLSDTDIRDALSAASAVGDDRIQSTATGRVNPEAWTHGSSEQRQKWFIAGYDTGQIAACDTYSAADLDNPASLR